MKYFFTAGEGSQFSGPTDTCRPPFCGPSPPGICQACFRVLRLPNSVTDFIECLEGSSHCLYRSVCLHSLPLSLPPLKYSWPRMRKKALVSTSNQRNTASFLNAKYFLNIIKWHDQSLDLQGFFKDVLRLLFPLTR